MWTLKIIEDDSVPGFGAVDFEKGSGVDPMQSVREKVL